MVTETCPGNNLPTILFKKPLFSKISKVNLKKSKDMSNHNSSPNLKLMD